MKKELTSRQFCFLLITSMISLKFMALPSLLSKDLGRDIYLLVGMFLVLDLVVLVFGLKLMRKFKDINFLEYLKNKIGRVFTSVIFFLVGIYFLFKIILLTVGVESFFKINFFAELPVSTFIVPLLLLSVYMVKKGLIAYGRTIEVLIWGILFAVIMVIVLGAGSANITNIFPLAKSGSEAFFSSGFDYILWFGDVMFIFLLIGKVDIDKKFEKKCYVTYASSAIMIMLFYLFYIGMFENNMPYHTLGLSDMAQNAVRTNTFFQVDFMPILLWISALFFEVAFTFHLIVSAFGNATKKENEDKILYVMAGISLIIFLYLRINVEKIVVIATDALSYPSIIIMALVYIFMVIFSFSKKKNLNKYERWAK